MANSIYQNLVELQSLDVQIKKHMDICDEEKPRLAHIEKLRARKEAELANAEEKSQSIHLREREIEKTLHDFTGKLALNADHQMRAKSQEQVTALEKEQQLFSKAIKELEEEQFTLLETHEANDALIDEAKKFLSGSLETLEETKDEIDKLCEAEYKQIDGYEKRRSALLELLPKEFRLTFESVLKVHRFKKPLSFITERKCGHCHFHLDSMLASEVFTAKSPQTCPSCNRLLIDRDQI